MQNTSSTSAVQRKFAAGHIHDRIDYAIQRIARRARVSAAQATVIAELLGLMQGERRGG